MGFEPHPDFELFRYVLEDEGQFEPGSEVEFGHEGKPLYIQGPDDNTEWVLAQLEKNAGEGNYHFILGGGDLPF